jgi:hypothetical protein
MNTVLLAKIWLGIAGTIIVGILGCIFYTNPEALLLIGGIAFVLLTVACAIHVSEDYDRRRRNQQPQTHSDQHPIEE